ncbi:hypothetical protein [Staphylococcus saccharolyticus]|uniref:DUF4870 domain-containing protein n=1 Tax=Staphylococcus saccharolyticus TaxID=33028 RepID=A0A380GX62_9STAP|nr:hypothetical protein [Staphylococcus saccharolyticus]MBL7564589.1 hypothetical protein [Staphylococcus saccharolyticus]MBL7571147.1 hypothetical protein [Staphylococcus saccharolyticus]QQB98991.1 hypothetical protein I6I31_03305 [Staphylococcus saccharolyticus]QRJ66796.1 hypothetical protein DMB76_001045 [Staphylococcus saccharolyticus]RTY00237.1 hypothetical protein CD145_00590 [Staphylococcus saccharolyticus]
MENYDERYSDKTSNVLGALSYLSVFFAPVLFPLIVWIVSQPPASNYSRNALFNHIFSWVFVALGFVSLLIGTSMGDSANFAIGITIWIIVAVLFFIWSLVLFIINIVRGIKLLII